MRQHSSIGADRRETSRTYRQDCRCKGNCMHGFAVFPPRTSHGAFRKPSRLHQLFANQPANRATRVINIPEQVAPLNGNKALRRTLPGFWKCSVGMPHTIFIKEHP